MSTVEEIENVLRSWAGSVSGRPAFIHDKMGPVPRQPYVTVRIAVSDPLPHDTFTRNQDCTEQTIRGLTLLDIEVSAWGGNDTKQVVNRLRASIQADSRYADLWTVLGKGGISPTNNLTTEYRGSLRRRELFTMSYYANLSETFTTDTFTTSQITVNEDQRGQVSQHTIGIDNPPAQLAPCNFPLEG